MNIQTRNTQENGAGRSLMLRALDLLRNVLREIFDESAYARFLERCQLVSSREAYGEFLREGQAARERRPRCC